MQIFIQIIGAEPSKVCLAIEKMFFTLCVVVVVVVAVVAFCFLHSLTKWKKKFVFWKNRVCAFFSKIELKSKIIIFLQLATFWIVQR